MTRTTTRLTTRLAGLAILFFAFQALAIEDTRYLQVFTTAAAVASRDPATSVIKTNIYIEGFLTAGDGKAGFYTYWIAATNSTNSETCFAPYTGVGRWMRPQSKTVWTEPTIQSLQNGTKPSNASTVTVSARTTAGDGGGGTFVFDTSSTTTTNAGTVFSCPYGGATGRWIRLYSGPLDGRWFGAKGSGDATAALQAALDLLNTSGGGTLHIPEQVNLVSNLSIYSNTRIEGTRGKSILQVNASQYYALAINQGGGGTSNTWENITNVFIQGVTLKGNALTEGANQFKHLCNFNAVSYLTIRDCDFLGALGDGIFLGSGDIDGLERHNEHVLIENCLFDGLNYNNRNGVSVCEGKHIVVRGCTARNLTATGMPGFFDIEPNGHGFERVEDITAEENFIEKCGGDAAFSMNIYNALGGSSIVVPSKITIRNNTISSTNSFTAFGINLRTTVAVGTNTPNMDIVVEYNKCYQPVIPPIFIAFVRGYRIDHNDFSGGNYAQVGYPGDVLEPTPTMDGSFSFNTMKDSGGDIGMVSIGRVNGLKLEGGLFIHPASGSTEAGAFLTFYGGLTNSATNVTVCGNSFIAGAHTNLASIMEAINCAFDTNSLNYYGNLVSGGPFVDLTIFGVGDVHIPRGSPGSTSIGSFSRLVSMDTTIRSASTFAGIEYDSDSANSDTRNFWAGAQGFEFGDYVIRQGLTLGANAKASGTNRFRVRPSGVVDVPQLSADTFTTPHADITNFYSTTAFKFHGPSLDTNFNGISVFDFVDRVKIGYTGTSLLGTSNTPSILQWANSSGTHLSGTLEVAPSGSASADIVFLTGLGLAERVIITGSGQVRINGVQNFADNAAAISGGLTNVGTVYRNGDVLMIVH